MEQVLVIGILLLVQMIMMIVIVVKISKMHGYISGVTKRVETYLDVVLQEADYENDAADSEKNSVDNMSVQEAQMRETIERKQKKQQEAIFEAVLQEIFP